MDDYYSLLGVDADATTDDIREAYRTRKDALDAGSDAGKADAAKLNKAWNVLSDPYQRGRYDQQRADGLEIDDDTADDIAASSNGAAKTPAAAPRGRQGRQPREQPQPTIALPAGTRWPLQKERLIAMAIDLVVLFVLIFVGSALLVPAVTKSQKPEVVKQVDRLTKIADDATKTKNDAKEALDDAKKVNPPVQADVDRANAAYNDAKAKETDAVDAVNKEARKLNGLSIMTLGFLFLVGLLYLIVPSLKSGATIGKRRQHLRVLRADGQPATTIDLLKRYGLPLVVTYAFVVTPLGLIGAVIVMFGVTMWMRNANFQGLHDRVARTIVVADAS